MLGLASGQAAGDPVDVLGVTADGRLEPAQPDQGLRQRPGVVERRDAGQGGRDERRGRVPHAAVEPPRDRVRQRRDRPAVRLLAADLVEPAPVVGHDIVEPPRLLGAARAEDELQVALGEVAAR
jgi:hypothetical protein